MKKLSFLFLLVVSVYLVHSAAAQSQREHCVMFYNVENLFHPSDDGSEGDDDFTPTGVRRWNFYRYNQKIAAICKLILAVNGWEPPDAVCFSEIENREVLDDIIFHPLLLGQQYFPLHRDSPDHRGIDVGIIYRQDRLRCIDTAWLEIRNADGELVRTREILAATFRVKNSGDTIVIFANHWTSKYGGAMETEAKRILQARTLGKHIDSLLNTRMPDRHIDALPDAGSNGTNGTNGTNVKQGKHDTNGTTDTNGTQGTTDTQGTTGTQGTQGTTGKLGTTGKHRPFGISVIAGGDLNDLSGSAPVQMLTDAFRLEEVLPGVAGGPSKSYGSYKYQGNWGSIDHVFVGGRLRAEYCRATVFQHPLLLEKDTKYTGEKPYRTYNGFSYHGGISDHLPLLLHFVVPEYQKNDP